MVYPSQLLENLQYDKNMDQEGALEVYLKKFNQQITSILNGKYQTSNTVVEKQYGNITLKIHCADEINLVSENQSGWSVSRGAMVNIGNKAKSLSDLFCEVELKGRNIPSEEIFKYDITLLKEYFFYNSTNLNSSYHDSVPTVLLFSKKSALCLLGMVVSSLLAQGVAVMIAATQEVALLAHIFTTMLLDAGVPCEAIHLCIIENEKVVESFKNKFNAMIELHTRGFCGVVVTETSDIDSVVTMLASQRTHAHVSPLRVGVVLVQESVKDLFKDNLNLVISERDNETISIVEYRSTKELLNLINNSESMFAISLWSDSVSICNEITLGANVPIVWINTFGKLDPSASIKIREQFGAVFGGDLGNKRMVPSNFCTEPPENVTMSLLQEQVKQAKERLKKWKLLDSSMQFYILSTSLEKIPDLTKEEDSVKKILKQVREDIKFNTEVKVIGSYLRTQTLEPVGTALVQVESTEELATVIASIFKGNAVIFVAKEMDSIHKIIEFLSNMQVLPVVLNNDKRSFQIAEKIDEIKSIRFLGQNLLPVLYNTKTVWSSAGETFAN